MKRLIFAGGKMPTKEELLEDDLIIQMLQEAEEKGKAEAVKDAKKIILQSLTVEDVEALPQAVVEKILETKKEKQSLLQKLAAEKVTLKI
jgi:membrane-bound ClpP family serine protease